MPPYPPMDSVVFVQELNLAWFSGYSVGNPSEGLRLAPQYRRSALVLTAWGRVTGLSLAFWGPQPILYSVAIEAGASSSDAKGELMKPARRLPESNLQTTQRRSNVRPQAAAPTRDERRPVDSHEVAINASIDFSLSHARAHVASVFRRRKQA